MTDTISDKNDLYSLFPLVAEEWDYEKNAYEPSEVKAFSNKKAWWKCSKGHSWEAVISTRSKGSGCPYCYGRMAIVGVNDLQTTRPDLAEEWDYEKNSHLKPTDFKQSSGKKCGGNAINVIIHGRQLLIPEIELIAAAHIVAYHLRK